MAEVDSFSTQKQRYFASLLGTSVATVVCLSNTARQCNERNNNRIRMDIGQALSSSVRSKV
jgi:hypothetical protein